MTAGDGTCALTVVIPTHNRPAMLREAVASALAACPSGAEVLVVDDRSDPPAAEGLADLLAADGRLRATVSNGPPGAAGARNAGVTAARGAVVLFLDDDDWLLAGYPDRVLAAAGAHEVGFCATTSDTGPARVRGLHGPIPEGSPLRRRLMSFSAGLWIRRDLYRDLGGCDPAQRIDEDTEFCCRLAARGLRPWYDATPGVRLRSAPAHADRLTRATPAAEVVACYRRTWDRHQGSFGPWSEARWHLATRLVRRAVREGRPDDARAAIATMTPLSFRAALWAFFQAKRLGGARRAAPAGRADA